MRAKLSIPSDFPDQESKAIVSDSLWTVKDVARFLRLEPGTVRAMAKRGDLPAVKVGRVWRFSPAQIQTWLKQKYPAPVTLA